MEAAVVGAFILFDFLLGFLLLGLAWSLLAARDLFKGVVLFIVFGLLMAMAWVRLQAPDIALAEAAIGSGLTGALLLNAVTSLSNRKRPRNLGRTLETAEKRENENR